MDAEHRGQARAALPWPELCFEDQCALTQLAEYVFWVLAGEQCLQNYFRSFDRACFTYSEC